jgi:uncharacterized protein
MMTQKNTILIFARYPTPGAAKTRLIPNLGAVGAANAHKALCEATLICAKASGFSLALAYTGAALADFQKWLGNDIAYVPQIEGDLGDKLTAAMDYALNTGIQKLFIIGSDCPYISADHFREAATALENHDIAIGPAFDGGYYLIALKASHASLFKDIAWSTEQVFEQTCRAAAEINLSVKILETLADIDTIDEWQRWQTRL